MFVESNALGWTNILGTQLSKCQSGMTVADRRRGALFRSCNAKGTPLSDAAPIPAVCPEAQCEGGRRGAHERDRKLAQVLRQQVDFLSTAVEFRYSVS